MEFIIGSYDCCEDEIKSVKIYLSVFHIDLFIKVPSQCEPFLPLQPYFLSFLFLSHMTFLSLHSEYATHFYSCRH